MEEDYEKLSQKFKKEKKYEKSIIVRWYSLTCHGVFIT